MKNDRSIFPRFMVNKRGRGWLLLRTFYPTSYLTFCSCEIINKFTKPDKALHLRILWGHAINEKWDKSTTARPITTKYDRIVTFSAELLPKDVWTLSSDALVRSRDK